MKLKILTEKRNAPPKRRYDDACGTAHALDLIGDRWSLLVMRELLLGPKRFSDLRNDLPGISANVLIQRLERLARSGLVERRRLPPPASTQVYALTKWGEEAEPIVCALGRWAARSPAHDPTLPLSGTSLMLSFRTMFDAGKAKGFSVRIGIKVGHERFCVTIAKGRLVAERGEIAAPDLLLEGAAPAIAALVYGGIPLHALEAEGALKVSGDRKLAKRFASLFPLPAKATLPG